MCKEFAKILVVQQKMIGDVLTSTILLEALREKYPKAELHYLVNSHTVPVLENNPFIDKLVLFTPEVEKSKWEFFRFLKKIRKEKYDVVIDVYGKISSMLISKFSGAAKRISYYKPHTAFFHTHTVKRLKIPEKGAGLAIENRLKLLDTLKIPFHYRVPKIFLSQKEMEMGKDFLENQGLDLDRPVFMLGVLGSSEKKTYPPRYMAQLIDQIAQQKPDAQLLFNYMPFQKKEAKFIFAHCRKSTKRQIRFDIFADGLRKFMMITKHCDALIGNEGGAVNIAKALGVPTFMIFCPFIGKQNWFGKLEYPKNQAVHLSDYVPMTQTDLKVASQRPADFYQKLKPELVAPQLTAFIENLDLGYEVH